MVSCLKKIEDLNKSYEDCQRKLNQISLKNEDIMLQNKAILQEAYKKADYSKKLESILFYFFDNYANRSLNGVEQERINRMLMSADGETDENNLNQSTILANPIKYDLNNILSNNKKEQFFCNLYEKIKDVKFKSPTFNSVTAKIEEFKEKQVLPMCLPTNSQSLPFNKKADENNRSTKSHYKEQENKEKNNENNEKLEVNNDGDNENLLSRKTSRPNNLLSGCYDGEDELIVFSDRNEEKNLENSKPPMNLFFKESDVFSFNRAKSAENDKNEENERNFYA
jgi:hypothetical protein